MLKLTAEQVREIRTERAAGAKYVYLASKFNVSHGAIWYYLKNYRRRRAYKNRKESMIMYDGTTADLKEIFRKIATGEIVHGSFLTTFAQAYINADPENKIILDAPARTIVVKYKLQSYADYVAPAKGMRA